MMRNQKELVPLLSFFDNFDGENENKSSTSFSIISLPLSQIRRNINSSLRITNEEGKKIYIFYSSLMISNKKEYHFPFEG